MTEPFSKITQFKYAVNFCWSTQWQSRGEVRFEFKSVSAKLPVACGDPTIVHLDLYLYIYITLVPSRQCCVRSGCRMVMWCFHPYPKSWVTHFRSDYMHLHSQRPVLNIDHHSLDGHWFWFGDPRHLVDQLLAVLRSSYCTHTPFWLDSIWKHLIVIQSNQFVVVGCNLWWKEYLSFLPCWGIRLPAFQNKSIVPTDLSTGLGLQVPLLWRIG